jgi:uncharacterized protein (TIGR00730 family)
MNVTIFGGSQPKEGDAAYAEAYQLGKQLAESGHTVLTGGYIGTMEAVSRGANEAGGHVIGVTCTEIEAWRKVKANVWVKEERHHQTLQERLNGLINGCDAAIALPGGPGTLTEIGLMWNLMIVDAIHRRPLILVGRGWQSTLDQAYAEMGVYFAENQRKLVQFAPDVQTAVKILENRKE